MAGRKIVIKTDYGAVATVDREKGIENTLNTALGVVSEQLQKLAMKSRTATFDEKESRILQSYIKSLVELSRENREQEKNDLELEKLKELSNDELLQLANEHLNEAKTKVEPEKP
jgi:hypothetical protein